MRKFTPLKQIKGHLRTWGYDKSTVLVSSYTILTLSPPDTTFVFCSVICLCSWVAYIANNMDLADQTVRRVQSDQGS